MGATDWKFLLDENIGRSLAEGLTRRDYYAELVVDVLAPGVADYTEILPYAREHDLVIVTKDYSDFSATSSDEHEGTILVARHDHTAADMAAGIETLVDAYPSRESFRGWQEFLDEWIS
jgi:hypothetical protein